MSHTFSKVLQLYRWEIGDDRLFFQEHDWFGQEFDFKRTAVFYSIGNNETNISNENEKKNDLLEQIAPNILCSDCQSACFVLLICVMQLSDQNAELTIADLES